MALRDKEKQQGAKRMSDIKSAKANTLMQSGFKKDLQLSFTDDLLNILKGNIQKDQVNRPYAQSYMVNKAVREIAENFPQAPYRVYKDGVEVPPDHEARKLFSKPNPKMSRFEFWEWVATYLNLNGEVFIYMVPSIGQMMDSPTRRLPAELWPLNPILMQHLLDENNEVHKWVYDSRIEVDPKWMIHIKLPNDHNTIRGLSPITAMQIEIETDYFAAQSNRTFYLNNGRVDGILSIDKELEISKDEIGELRRQWNQIRQGPDKGHDVAVVHGMDYKPVGINQRDMEYIKGRTFTREVVSIVFGVPLPILGIYDSATYSNAREAKGIFWRETLMPQEIRFQEKFQCEFWDRFAPELEGRFDFSVVPELRKDLNASLDAALKYRQLGYTRDEINKRLTLDMEPETDGGNVRWTTVQYYPEEGSTEPTQQTVKQTATEDLKLQDARGRTIYRRYQNLHRVYEKSFASKISRYFFEQRTKVLQSLDLEQRYNDEDLRYAKTADEMTAIVLETFDKEDKRLVSMLKPLYHESGEAVAELVQDSLGLTDKPVISESIILEREYVLKGINQTVSQDLRKTIYQGLQEGETVDQITTRVKEYYNRLTGKNKKHALTIARTESGYMMNTASFKMYEESGIAMKRWHGGSRTTHQTNASTGVVPIDHVYENGQLHPLDGRGGAKENANCTCFTEPVITR